MKKIYSEPKMLTVNSEIETDLLIMSLEGTDPTSGTEPGTEPGKTPGEDDDEEEIWGGAKGRNAWSNGGLW